MFRIAISLCLLSFSLGKSVHSGDSPPEWPGTYSVSGVLRLPYAEIVEPFQAWFDSVNGRSRIDYYAGKETLQITTLPSSSVSDQRKMH